MQLQIESIKPTAKSLVLKAGGKEYFAKKDSGISSGMTIEAETEDSDYNGKTYTWVKKWRAVAGATQAQPTGTSSATPNATAWLPFASNTVAHAISAGLCSDPSQVKAWAEAAKNAYMDLA